MFYTLFELSIGIRAGTLAIYLSVILDPLAMDEDMEKAMLNCCLNVCDNDSMSIFEDCPNNELLELLKKKKETF